MAGGGACAIPAVAVSNIGFGCGCNNGRRPDHTSHRLIEVVVYRRATDPVRAPRRSAHSRLGGCEGAPEPPSAVAYPPSRKSWSGRHQRIAANSSRIMFFWPTDPRIITPAPVHRPGHKWFETYCCWLRFWPGMRLSLPTGFIIAACATGWISRKSLTPATVLLASFDSILIGVHTACRNGAYHVVIPQRRPPARRCAIAGPPWRRAALPAARSTTRSFQAPDSPVPAIFFIMQPPRTPPVRAKRPVFGF